MSQTRRMSFAEALTNTAIGYLVALLAQIIIFPLFGLAVSLGQNIGIGLAFTGVSIVRSYAIRRTFEALR